VSNAPLLKKLFAKPNSLCANRYETNVYVLIAALNIFGLTHKKLKEGPSFFISLYTMYKRKFRPYPPIVKRRRIQVDFPRWLYAFYSVIVFVLVLIIADLYLKINHDRYLKINHDRYLKINNDLYLKINSSLSLDESC